MKSVTPISALRAAGALLVLGFASPALADQPASVPPVVPVRVQLPNGLSAASVETTRADDDWKYVSIDSMALHNPSRYFPQSYKPEQFHLLAGSHAYTPVVRPKLESLDLSQPGILAAAETVRVTVTFKVPVSVTSAQFEFLPHWQSDGGATVDFCCHY